MHTLLLVLWIAGAPAVAEPSLAAPETTTPRRVTASGVVFVCEHGSVKSLMAQEWFNRLARERGRAVTAASRAVTPDSSVPPAIADGLSREGFDVSRFRPRAFDASTVTASTHVVAIGVDPARLGVPPAATLESWDAIPPATQGYSAARDALKARIEALLAALEAQGRP